MKSFSFGRRAFCACVVATLLAGCGGSQPPIGAPGAMWQSIERAPTGTAARRVPSLSYQVLHRFTLHGNPDSERGGGAYPWAALLDVGGTLYGTTSEGGNENGGTVFSISTIGKKKTLYNFDRNIGSTDGVFPLAGLVNVKGTLYGTTSIGGTCASGTVYSVSTTGTETVLHSFCNSDGGNPSAGLTDVNGTLYGTTYQGIYGGPGTVYSVSTSGAFKVLHTFCGTGDGCGPVAGVVSVGGTLYGTTIRGGSGPCYSGAGCGTVFSISSAGMEKVLYSFQGGSDGQAPSSSLIDVNGALYGTTLRGGNSGCYPYDTCGTIFSVSTKGKEQVLYRFRGYSHDGGNPNAGLLWVGGVLYGTAQYGGYGSGYGSGTVFSFSSSGGEQVLHSFSGGSDGAVPTSDLIDVNGTLYGTTYDGGPNTHCGRRAPGCGTVFALTP
jgi:uncharacterized repeat protein (TIGR03803 family)